MSDPAQPIPRAKRLQKWLLTLLKIAIAVLGLCFVTLKFSRTQPPSGDLKINLGVLNASPNFHWRDTALIPAGTSLRNISFPQPTLVYVSAKPSPNGTVTIEFPNRPVTIRAEIPGDLVTADVVITADALLPGTNQKINLDHTLVISQSQLLSESGECTHPGLGTILKTASGKWPLLLAAWALLVIPFFVTAIRWRNLMRPQGLDMPLGKCLQLTFVGQFCSIMLPGITGGDLVKIVYAARLTGSKTKSFITIILDRVIGLVALMVIAGSSAGVQVWINHRAGKVDNTLVNVCVMITMLLAGLAACSTVYFSHRLRRLLGIEWFVEHLGAASGTEGTAKLEHLFRVFNGLLLAGSVLAAGALAILRWVVHLAWAESNTPMIYVGLVVLGLAALAATGALVTHDRLVRRFRPLIGKLAGTIVAVDDTLHVYRGHFGLLGWAFVISLISQMTLPLSAWLCGMALDMSSPMTHYLAYVPVAVLAASMPVSPPQGIGVMEGLLARFFSSTARAGQILMLVQGIRFLPILWNLCGAYWVVTGKYSRTQELKAEDK